MTFDDDFVVLRTDRGPVRATCVKLGCQWPPPELLVVSGGPHSGIWRRLRYSALTDEQRESTSHVCRGAEYVYEVPATALH